MQAPVHGFLAARWNIDKRLFPMEVKTISLFFSVKDFKQYLSASSTVIDAYPICVSCLGAWYAIPVLAPLEFICKVSSEFYLNLVFLQLPHCVACKIGWQSFNKRKKKMNAAVERKRSRCQTLMTYSLQCEWDEDEVGARRRREAGGVHSWV